jgi:hypothetical protein
MLSINGWGMAWLSFSLWLGKETRGGGALAWQRSPAAARCVRRRGHRLAEAELKHRLHFHVGGALHQSNGLYAW